LAQPYLNLKADLLTLPPHHDKTQRSLEFYAIMAPVPPSDHDIIESEFSVLDFMGTAWN
jgi:hypothetical protein